LSRDLDAQFVVEWQLIPIHEPEDSGVDAEAVLRLSQVNV
jgi:hypothetical protein